MSNPGPNITDTPLLDQTGLGINPSVAASGDGKQLGSSASSVVGFWGAIPIAQPSGASQAAVATTGSTNSSPYGYTTSAQADGIVTLLNAMRLALVNAGLMKGGA